MGVRSILRPWDSQPQEAVEIASRIARPALLFHPPAFLDVAGGIAPAEVNGSLAPAAGQGGLAPAFDGTKFLSFGASNQSASFTALVLFSVGSLASKTTLSQSSFLNNPSFGSDGSQQIRVEESGAVSLIRDSQLAVLGSAGGFVQAGRLHCAVVGWDNASGGGYIALDGRVIATASPGAQSWATGNLFVLGRKRDGNTQESGPHRTFLYARWSSALGQDFGATLSTDPWQLFEPRRLWGVASGGGTTITASVGAASAVGVSTHVDLTLNAGPAAASATGVTARLPRVIGTTPGAAAAAGLTAQLNRIFGTTTANAIAAGVTALVNNASATVGRPASDTSNSGWTASTGSDLFAMLDEITPSATDYIVATATGAVCELALNTTSYPGTASQVLKFRASSSTGNSVIVRLKNTGGATVRSATQLLTGTDTEYSIVLTAPEIAAITSGDLSVELESA